MAASFVNSLGITLISVSGGAYSMGGGVLPVPEGLGPEGYENEHPPYGDFDEFPMHEVTLSAFAMSACPITNAQYEQYDPAHRAWRGKYGYAPNDDDAVVFVSWLEEPMPPGSDEASGV